MKAVQLVEEIRLEFYENMEYNTYIYHRLLEVINKSGKVSAELNVAELGGNNKIFQFTLVAAQQWMRMSHITKSSQMSFFVHCYSQIVNLE